MEFPQLIKALQNPEIYPEQAPKVELVQTHISVVLLVGDKVYKIKKTCRFWFSGLYHLRKKEILLRARGGFKSPAMPRNLFRGCRNKGQRGPGIYQPRTGRNNRICRIYEKAPRRENDGPVT